MFFSIVIPTYNREKVLVKTLETVFLQSFTDFEIILIDDGSTDTTEQTIRSLKNERLHYVKTENCGVAHARNIGIQKAKGEYIGFLDSDDLMEINHLQTAFDLIQSKNNPEVVHLNFLYGNADRINAQKNKLPLTLPDDIFKSCSLHVNCIFIKNEIAKHHLFNESRDLMFAEDWDFFIKLAVRYSISLLDKTTIYLIDHVDRNMRNFDEAKWVKRRDAIVESIENDKVITENYHSGIKQVSAHMNSLIALNLALSKERKKCLRYWVLSLKQNYKELFTKRSIAVLKHLLIP